jgi:uncharacterized protein
MAQLSFETLTFRQRDDILHVDLLRSWTTKIPMEEVNAIAECTVINPHTIEFEKLDEDKASTKFSFLLNKHFSNLTTKLTGNACTYIHRNSGIPLIGNVAFGIVYRGSSIIEIKTNNGCNLDCVYCSISEGLSSKKHDFVVEKDYLVEELRKLIDFIGEEVEIHIGVQGEPFLYGDMENLIEDLQAMDDVHRISIDTNGTYLNKERLDRLKHCPKLQFNLSLDALDAEVAQKIAGTKAYKIDHVKDVIAYASTVFPRVVVAPVRTKGWNEEEVEKIVEWIAGLEKRPIVGIQNFLRYKTGRNPGKEVGWDEFYKELDRLQDKYGVRLKLDKDFFDVRKTKALPKPFMKGDVIKAVIKCPDRFDNSVLASAKERNISVPGCKYVKDKKISVEIMRDKHNVFTGRLS